MVKYIMFSSLKQLAYTSNNYLQHFYVTINIIFLILNNCYLNDKKKFRNSFIFSSHALQYKHIV